MCPTRAWPRSLVALLLASLLLVACDPDSGEGISQSSQSPPSTPGGVESVAASHPEPTASPAPGPAIETSSSPPAGGEGSGTADDGLATPLAPPAETGASDEPGGAVDGIPSGTQRAEVTVVIDGDTIDVEVLEEGDVPFGEHRIRLLEIDTPEREDDCYETATDFLAELIPVGSEVHLERDVEDVDPNGRYLRYVWAEPAELVNLTMVVEGLAEAFIFPLNQLHAPAVRAAEAEAQDLGLGIWGAYCDGRR